MTKAPTPSRKREARLCEGGHSRATVAQVKIEARDRAREPPAISTAIPLCPSGYVPADSNTFKRCKTTKGTKIMSSRN